MPRPAAHAPAFSHHRSAKIRNHDALQISESASRGGALAHPGSSLFRSELRARAVVVSRAFSDHLPAYACPPGFGHGFDHRRSERVLHVSSPGLYAGATNAA